MEPSTTTPSSVRGEGRGEEQSAATAQTFQAAPNLFGLLAQFDRPQALVEAAARVRHAGYRRFEAYAPMPVDGLADAMALPPSRMPLVVLLGGLIGRLGG